MNPFDFAFGMSTSSGVSASSPFINNAPLVVGSDYSGSGVEGISSDPTQTSSASTQPSASSRSGSVPAGYAQGSYSSTGSLSSLFGNSTLWLAIGAIATIALYFKLHKK